MEDAKATNADKLRALELLDRLPAVDDRREFTLAEIEDELGADGLDALFAEPMTIAHAAQLEARAILQNDERFNAEVQRVALMLAEQARTEAHEARRRADEAERRLADVRETQTMPRARGTDQVVVALRSSRPDADVGWPGREQPSWGVQPRPTLG